MMTKQGSTNIINSMTQGAGVLVLGRGHINHLVKIFHYKSSLPYGIIQTNQENSYDGHGRLYQIVNFMTPRAGVLVLECGHISQNYLLLYQYVH